MFMLCNHIHELPASSRLTIPMKTRKPSMHIHHNRELTMSLGKKTVMTKEN
uniref:Ubiquitin-conjugating enzyme E2 j2 n=1 Tax=Rhizophora mucronata TaxID=61149 RepID=A0A2P2L917_RHIMU